MTTMKVSRPWWQSSFMFDSVDTGGIGVTGAVFRGFGPPGDPLGELPQMTDTEKSILATGALLLGSTVGGLLGYGLYGHLMDKGWNTWSAGAATGLLGGVGAMVIIHSIGAITGKKFVG